VKTTLDMINRMQADGVIGKYAIGGAVGVIFYLEAFYTEDLDVFVVLPTTPGSSLLSLSPIYEYLTEHGCKVDGERIVIGDWPVQFLPPQGALEQEALDEAVNTDYEGTPTYVLSAEYLVAIALKTGRAKDYARVAMFLDQDAVNLERLNSILLRHGLLPKWERFKSKFSEES
jgi:hypothetical protein